MAPVPYVSIQNFVRYDGRNGPEFAAYMERTILSDNGTTMIVEQTVPIVYPDDIQIGDAFSPQVGFLRAADFDRMYALKTDMEPPATVGTMDALSLQVPVLLLGASVERTVTWNRPFPADDYDISFLFDANIIGKVNAAVKVVNGKPVKSVTGATIVISAALAVTVSGVLHVLATTNPRGRRGQGNQGGQSGRG